MSKLDKMTLADKLLRETLRPHTLLAKLTTQPLDEIRRSLMTAKRFVLDADMSGFLAELSQLPFRCNRQRQSVILDSIRYSAKLPAPSTWVEWDGPAFRNSQIALGCETISFDGSKLVTAAEVPERWGFLLQEHPTNPNAIRLREYCSASDGGLASPPMFHWVYSTTDDLLPWKADTYAGIIATGLRHIHCEHIGVVYEGDEIDKRWRQPLHIPHHHDYKGVTNSWVIELSGVVRYVLSFLATLNDAPVTRTDVMPAASFFARGKHRKFLAHTELRLKLPHNADRTRVAARLIVAAKRRMHEVLPHWRILAKPGQMLCEPGTHLWASIDDKHGICTVCKVPRTHVRAHTRGSGLQGVVSHSTYRVTH